MLRACSHLVIATEDVPRLTRFFGELFLLKPHFENEAFAEFVLPSKFRIAFFKPVGAAAKFFQTTGPRGATGIGLTVDDVDALHARLAGELTSWQVKISGPPKTHPWGEKSFLFCDPDGNRWEIAQSPSADGMLVARE